MVRRAPLEWPSGMPVLRIGERPGRRGPHNHAVPLPREGLPQAIQRQDGHRHGRLESRLSGVGHRHLPDADQHQGRIQHEVAPRPGNHAKVGLASGPPAPQGMGDSGRLIHRPGRDRRDLHRREAQEHVEHQAERTGGDRQRRGWQGSRGWREGPGKRAGFREDRRAHLSA